MFTLLKLENFKSFKNVTLDIRGKYKKPKKFIFIYGENGSGKSNLVYAFNFLRESIHTLDYQNKMEELFNNPKNIPPSNYQSLISNKYLPFYFTDLKKLRDEVYMIGSTDDMVLEFHFTINDIEGVYRLVFDDTLKEESLYYLLDERRGFLYNLKRDTKQLSNKIFKDDDYRKDLEGYIEQYWGKHTFMSILENERHKKNQKFIKKRVSNNLFEVINYLRNFSIRYKYGRFGEKQIMNTQHFALVDLKSGVIPISDEKILEEKEELVRYFLTSLYSDIKDVYYSKKFDSDNNEIEYKLFLKKLIGNKIRDIDFTIESTGTQNLLDILLPLIEVCLGNTAIIDEADSGIHDLLFNELIENVGEVIEGQLIITTHNTTLLENLNNENIYFIQVDSNGNKRIVNINDFDTRTQMYHNIRERYLKGIYGGVPIPGSLDFETIVEILDTDNGVNYE